jgi:hypothetical protein
MIKTRILIEGIKLVGVGNKLIGEFSVEDLLDIGFIKTVLEGTFVAECQTLATLVFNESRFGFLIIKSLW